ncbi:MAG: response regulator transcription factor [Deltaproteobacteria bacterium]|nr:response regulator transcription factor [Deltaproteobacteria bacterium]
MKVLIAEDDEHIRAGLIDILRAEGYQTIEAADGNAAVEQFESEHPDFVCLDIMMPGMNGYDVCRKIRETSQVPIVFISAKSEEIDKVVGLELGADDFIVKPFGVKEVIARIRAVTRRCFAAKRPEELPRTFVIADLEVFPAELRARRGDQTVELSLREVKLLELFSRNVGVVLERNAIFDECWDANYFPSSRTLDQHIAKLRKKIEQNPKEPRIIQTVHGVGYRYDG